MSILDDAIEVKMTRANVSRVVAAALIDVSENVLGRSLNGSRPLPGHKILELDHALNDLIAISKIVYPFSIPSTNVACLKVLIDRYRTSGLDKLVDTAVVSELRERLDEIQNVR